MEDFIVAIINHPLVVLAVVIVLVLLLMYKSKQE
jgi:hypothetical protein